MPRLRRTDCASPGIRRIRRGRGFGYAYPDGSPVRDPETLARIRGLVLPPAWQDVWICLHPNGHIQAMGTDAAGRRQYRYHDLWRVQRDAEKHERVLEFARRLPKARQTVTQQLTLRGYPRDRVLAAAFRLLDLGFFRIGSEEYAEENHTYGLATILREHVHTHRDTISFEYMAKGNKERLQSVVDPTVIKVVRGLLRRDDENPELLAYRDARDGAWRDVKSGDINDYIHDVVGGGASAKDFRTWHATVLMAVGLAVSQYVPASETARKRAVTRAVKEVSDYLGNTPAVARASYIDPRVIDLYYDGVTVAPALERLGSGVEFGHPATHGRIEKAVLAMLTRAPKAAGRRTTASAGASRTAKPRPRSAAKSVTVEAPTPRTRRSTRAA